MSHATTGQPMTTGRLIHWAARYDLLVQVLTLGQIDRLRARIADQAQVKQGDAVLDIGCGTGDLARILVKRVGSNGSVSGIDASPEMIAWARQKARRRNVPIDFRLEPVEALSFPDRAFDVVVSSFVFHHLPGDLKREALLSIARVLKPGGRLCIVDFTHPSGQSRAHHGEPVTDWYLPEMMRTNGFTDVTSGQFGSIPLGFLMGLSHSGYGYVSARRASDKAG